MISRNELYITLSTLWILLVPTEFFEWNYLHMICQPWSRIKWKVIIWIISVVWYLFVIYTTENRYYRCGLRVVHWLPSALVLNCLFAVYSHTTAGQLKTPQIISVERAQWPSVCRFGTGVGFKSRIDAFVSLTLSWLKQ